MSQGGPTQHRASLRRRLVAISRAIRYLRQMRTWPQVFADRIRASKAQYFRIACWRSSQPALFFSVTSVCFCRDKRRRSGSRAAGPPQTDQAPSESYSGSSSGPLNTRPRGYGPGHSPAKRLRCVFFFVRILYEKVGFIAEVVAGGWIMNLAGGLLLVLAFSCGEHAGRISSDSKIEQRARSLKENLAPASRFPLLV